MAYDLEEQEQIDNLKAYWKQYGNFILTAVTIVLLAIAIVTALGTLASAGLAHGDLSPYNALVHRGRLVLIDLPQVVDVVINPQGPRFLARDVSTMARWFAARGLPEDRLDVPGLVADLLEDAGLR